MAPHYEAVGHIVGVDTTVRWLRTENNEVPTKMIRILDEWILTGEATWATLVLGLEHSIPRLRGLASDIRKDLREALEKCECIIRTFLFTGSHTYNACATN